MDKYKKNGVPSPCSYKPEEADKHTKKSSQSVEMSKYKIARSQDALIKTKKYVPGIGKYDIMKADKYIVRNPPLFRKGRR